MPILKRDNGISIYYEERGQKEAAETLLLLGGLTRDHTIWRKVLPYLEEKYRIILPDNRDAGQSSTAATEYGISELSEDMSDLIQSLRLCPVHVVGHSMGGFMAFHLAAKYPELIKTIILCSTAEKQTEAGISYLRGRMCLINEKSPAEAKPTSRDDIVAVMDKIYSPTSLKNEVFIEEMIDFETSNPYPQRADAFKRQAIACLHHNAEFLLRDIVCPVSIITGKHDRTFPPEVAYTLSTKMRRPTVTIIPDAGHMVQLEQPKLLSDTLEKFIVTYRHEPDGEVSMRIEV